MRSPNAQRPDPAHRPSAAHPGSAAHEIAEKAIALIQSQFHGLLVTLDEHGFPHSRVMGAATGDTGLRQLVCLSASPTRKLEHIRCNPRVCWMFYDSETHDTLLVKGLAHVVSWADRTAAVWDQLAKCTAEHSLAELGHQDGEGFRAVVTDVVELEYVDHRDAKRHPQVLRFTAPERWAEHVPCPCAER